MKLGHNLIDGISVEALLVDQGYDTKLTKKSVRRQTFLLGSV